MVSRVRTEKKPIKTLIEERKTWIEIKTPSYEPPNIESAAEHVIHGIQLTGDMSEHEKSILKFLKKSTVAKNVP